MSIQAMTWVFDKAPADLKPSETLTLLVLANHSNGEGGHSYPSVGRIAKESKLGESTVREALATLVTRGILEIQSPSTNRMPAMYKFRGVADPGWMPELLHSGGAESGGPKSGTPKSGGPESVTRPADSGTLEVQNLAPNHQITNREPSKDNVAREASWMDEDFVPVDEEGQSYGKGPQQHHPQPAPPRQAPTNNPGVSNQNNGEVYGEDVPFRTVEEELAHSYWTPENKEYFKALIEPYPKHKLGEQNLSMHAWRTVVGDLASSQEWAEEYWRGLHNWLMKWNAEKTEAKFIPWFPNFIKNRKWQGSPPPPPQG